MTEPSEELYDFCAKEFGVPIESFKKSFLKFEDNLVDNSLTEKQVWEKVSAELRKPNPNRASLWGDAFRAAYHPRQEMFDLAAKVHNNGYRTALLSNIEIPVMGIFLEQGYTMFDVQIFSCVEGVAKPDERIYRRTLHHLCVAPDEAVFIDDKQKYVDAAKHIGIEGIVYQTPEQVKRELQKLNVKID